MKQSKIYPVAIIGLLLIFTPGCKKDDPIDDPKDEPIEDPAEFEGGIGTQADPYLIATPEQLDDVRNYPDKHFKQIADIDLSGYSSGEGWQPIGGWEKSFSGTFDGNSYKITNLFIYSPYRYDIGLFGNTDNSKIKNVVVVINEIIGMNNVGGLVGANSDRGTIINCYATGNVAGDHSTGGLVGMNAGNIKDSYASVDVSGSGSGGLVGLNNDGGYISNSYASGDVSGYRVGGLIGRNVGGSIINSYSTGDVSGSDSGGLVGLNSHEGDIINCYATGNVSGSGAGGLVGINDADIINCYATGNVSGNGIGGLVGINGHNITNSYATGDASGNRNIGGLVGFNTDGGNINSCYAVGSVSGYEHAGGFIGFNLYGGYITNCYAAGDVSGYSYIGGLAGVNEGDIINCYATGIVSGDRNLGGLVGVNFRWNHEGNTRYSYYDKETSGQHDKGKGIPKTTAEMMRQSTFQTWDFSNIWAIDEGNSYPYFRWKE